jgi:peptidoglycan/LPS O-acetylase OafA/YrhL
MGLILARLIDMLRLRSGPQDLPGGWSLAILLSLVYIAQGFVADGILGETDTAARSLLAISIQFLAIGMLLKIRNQSSRLPQTLSALAGVGLIFGIFSIILILQANPDEDQPKLALIWLAVFLWSLAVDAHIYRRALSTTLSMGILVSVLIFAGNFILIQSIFR